MKKLQNLLFYIILIIFPLCVIECKKDTGGHQFDAIQAFIQGKWKLEYVQGGIANVIRSFHNENVTWQFYSGNRITVNYNGAIYTDTTISWSRSTNRGLGTGTDLAYIMSFYENGGNNIKVVDGIINDSLILHDNADDGQYYHFSKSH